MTDLDELERLVAQMAPGPWVAPRVDVSTPAQGTPAPYALSITGQGPRMFTVDRCKYMHADDAAEIARALAIVCGPCIERDVTT